MGEDARLRRAPAAPGGRQRSILVAVATAVVSVLVAAGLAEGLARLHEWATGQAHTPAASRLDPVDVMFGAVNFGAPGLVERDPVLGYRLRPGAESSLYVINADGYRGSAVGRSKPAGTYRIVAVGGSTTFGWGVAEDDGYPRILEGLLNRRCAPALAARFEVINAGVPGYISTQDWVALATRWQHYQPDLVTVMTGLNDVAAGLVGTARLDPPTLSPLAGWLRRVRAGALRRSAFARWSARQLQRWSGPPVGGGAAAPALAQQTTAESLEGIHQVVRAHGIELALVGYPGLSERDGAGFPMADNPRLQEAVRGAMARGLGPVMALQKDWARGHGVTWADPRELFRARGPQAELYLSDGIHLTRAGNALLADLVYDAVFKERCGPAGERARPMPQPPG